MTVRLYPFDLPDGVHPMGWAMLGHGLTVEQINAICVVLFDRLGARLHEVTDHEEQVFSWAVDWALDPGGRTPASVGDEVDILVPGGDRTAVQVTGGALPPGVRLEKHTGRLVGAFARPGLYSVTVTVGAQVKYDPLGTPGGPQNVGEWIPIDKPRHAPTPAPQPQATLADMSPQELEELIVQAQQAQRARLIAEGEGMR